LHRDEEVTEAVDEIDELVCALAETPAASSAGFILKVLCRLHYERGGVRGDSAAIAPLCTDNGVSTLDVIELNLMEDAARLFPAIAPLVAAALEHRYGEDAAEAQRI
jgi:hypothetical protein